MAVTLLWLHLSSSPGKDKIKIGERAAKPEKTTKTGARPAFRPFYCTAPLIAAQISTKPSTMR